MIKPVLQRPLEPEQFLSAAYRIVEVNDAGVISYLVPPSDVGLSNSYTDASGDVVPYHVQDEPDGVAGPTGRHDTNTDVDHGSDEGAIVVQLMPFVDTPNMGGVYKAWVTPLDVYIDKGETLTSGKGKFAEVLHGLEILPDDRGAITTNGKVKTTLGFNPDPGFGPPRNIQKTDNFKVKEFVSSAITVQKFFDVNGDGIWDVDEPEIDGTNNCVTATGALTDCGVGGGWPYDFTEPLADGTTHTETNYTNGVHAAGVAGTYTATEGVLNGWTQTALIIDGVSQAVSPTASVDVTGNGGNHTIVFGNSLPDVTVDKSPVEAVINAGELASFTITVTNLGPVQADDVTLSDSLPGNGWSIDSDTSGTASLSGSDLSAGPVDLAVGDSFTIVVSRPTSADECDDEDLAGDIYNVVSVSATNEADTSNNVDDANIVVNCPDIVVVKTASSAEINAGELAGFSIMVSNEGPGDAINAVLTDVLPGISASWLTVLPSDIGVTQIGNDFLVSLLTVSDSFTIFVSATTTAADCGTITNVAYAGAGNEPVGAIGDNNSDEASIVVLCPDVEVVKTAVDAEINAGDTASFSIAVTNNGPGVAYGVTLTDTLPGDGWAIDSDTSGLASLTGSLLSTTATDLAEGAGFVIVVSRATSPAECDDDDLSGDIYNLAEVEASNEPDGATGNNSDDATIVVLCPDVKVVKTAVDAEINAGDTASFSIAVTNNGPGVAYGVTLTDTLPGDGWAIDSDASGLASLSGSVLSTTATDLAVGEGFVIVVSRTASPAECDDDDLSGDIYNLAEVEASNEPDGATGNNSDNATIVVLCPDVVVVKSASDSSILVGGTASFTMEVTNNGPGVAYGVTLTDTLPGDGWAVASQTGTDGTAAIAGTSLTAGPVDLAVGESFSITVSRSTNLDDCGVIDNVAEVGVSNEPNGATGNNTDDATIAVACPSGAGLTPGFWKNWDNHFTVEQFELLLPTSVASTIEEVDEIFADYNNNDPTSGEMLKVFVLANELTINLATYNFENDLDLPNPSGGTLYGAVVIVVGGVEYELGEALEDANEYLLDGTINGEVPTDEEITALKTILDLFANLNNS